MADRQIFTFCFYIPRSFFFFATDNHRARDSRAGAGAARTAAAAVIFVFVCVYVCVFFTFFNLPRPMGKHGGVVGGWSPGCSTENYCTVRIYVYTYSATAQVIPSIQETGV